MAYSEKFTCDICGAERGAVNHWFLASDAGYNVGSLVIIPFTVAAARSDVMPRAMLCGESCVSKWVSANLDTLYFDYPLTRKTEEYLKAMAGVHAATPPGVESARQPYPPLCPHGISVNNDCEDCDE